MAVGDPSKLRSELLDSRFRAAAMGRQAPDRRFPDGKMRADLADQMVRDELFLDGNARQNLATFCQTWDDELRAQAHGSVDQQELDRQGGVSASGARPPHGSRAPAACA